MLKLAPKYLSVVAVIAGSLIFLPENWLEVMGLKKLAAENKQWLGLAFIICIGVCLVAIASWAIDLVADYFQRNRIRGFVIDKLNDLTEEEKQILRYYYAKDSRSNTLRVDDGVVQELVACGIIYRSTGLGNLLEGFSHNISDTAWGYIRSNPSVLKGTTNTYRTDKRKHLW